MGAYNRSGGPAFGVSGLGTGTRAHLRAQSHTGRDTFAVSEHKLAYAVHQRDDKVLEHLFTEEGEAASDRDRGRQHRQGQSVQDMQPDRLPSLDRARLHQTTGRSDKTGRRLRDDRHPKSTEDQLPDRVRAGGHDRASEGVGPAEPVLYQVLDPGAESDHRQAADVHPDQLGPGEGQAAGHHEQ